MVRTSRQGKSPLTIRDAKLERGTRTPVEGSVMNGHDEVTRHKTPTDQELKHEVAAGNQEAGDTLHGRSAPSAFGIASQTLDRAAPEDIVRERHRFILIVVFGALVTAALAVFGLKPTPDYSLCFFGSSAGDALRLLFRAFSMWVQLPGMATVARPIGRTFAAKILLARSRTLPGWAVPIACGLLVAAIGVLWYSSTLWFFNGYHLSWC
jgi:hypothetical protein